MADSKALQELKSALEIAHVLLEIEKNNYSNPPKSGEQKAVQGLRGGAAVLMVAAFEYFLRQVIEEHLSELTTMPPKVNFEDLPEKMRITNVYQTLERAMKGSRFQGSTDRIDRLKIIEVACKVVISGVISPSSFSDTGSNPSAKNVKEMFKGLGVDNVFGTIKDRFERQWRKPVATTFIADKLEEIVQRRHRVAHTANALNITRSELNESIKFLKIVATLLDMELRRHIRDIIRSGQAP